MVLTNITDAMIARLTQAFMVSADKTPDIPVKMITRYGSYESGVTPLPAMFVDYGKFSGVADNGNGELQLGTRFDVVVAVAPLEAEAEAEAEVRAEGADAIEKAEIARDLAADPMADPAAVEAAQRAADEAAAKLAGWSLPMSEIEIMAEVQGRSQAKARILAAQAAQQIMTMERKSTWGEKCSSCFRVVEIVEETERADLADLVVWKAVVSIDVSFGDPAWTNTGKHPKYMDVYLCAEPNKGPDHIHDYVLIHEGEDEEES